MAVGSVAIAGTLFTVWQITHRQPEVERVQQVNVLSRDFFLDILRKIRVAFSERNLQLLRSFRNLRRHEERGSAKYRAYVKEMMLATKDTLKTVSRQVLSEHCVTKEMLDGSRTHYDQDPEVRSALRRMCTPLPRDCNITNEVLREILGYYLSRLNEMRSPDVDSLAISMQVLADDLYDEFGLEAEEIEFASVNADPRIQQQVLKIRQKTDELIDEAVLMFPKSV